MAYWKVSHLYAVWITLDKMLKWQPEIVFYYCDIMKLYLSKCRSVMVYMHVLDFISIGLGLGFNPHRGCEFFFLYLFYLVTNLWIEVLFIKKTRTLKDTWHKKIICLHSMSLSSLSQILTLNLFNKHLLTSHSWV